MILDSKTLKKIKKAYEKGKTYKDIEKKYGVTSNQITYLIRSNKWQRESNKSEALKGNQNAAGNCGGGAPENNKNAVTTGEYESIFSDFYSDKEKMIAQRLKETTNYSKLEQDIELYTIRETRIMQRIQELRSSKKDLTIESITRHKTNSMNSDGTSSESTSTHAELTMDKIQKLEESLTRVQQAKVKAIDRLHKMMQDGSNVPPPTKSLADAIQEAYENKVGDT